MATRQWHYVQDGRQAGPVGEEVLKGMAASGALRPSDLVWTDGFAEWLPASRVPDIFPRAAAKPVEADDVSVSPYEAPKVQVSSATYGGDGDMITTGIKRVLADTRPWVLFMSILIFIGCGLFALGSLFMLFVMPLVGILYVGFTVLYFFTGYHLFNYSSGIKTFLRTSRASDLHTALMAQKSFWKLVGIVTAVVMILWVLAFMFGIVAGAGIGPRLRE